jgi:hypothetical protein
MDVVIGFFGYVLRRRPGALVSELAQRLLDIYNAKMVRSFVLSFIRHQLSMKR